MCAAAYEENQVIVGADPHREPRLRHLRRQSPLVRARVVPLEQQREFKAIVVVKCVFC